MTTMMTRRQILRLLALGAASPSLEIDWEKLLWTPKPTIVVPTTYGISLGQIVALEMERMLPKIRTLFERDDVFFKVIKSRDIEVISNRDMRLPLVKKG